MIVVSDSSPLILRRIRRLHLLVSPFGRVVIPLELHHEVVVAGGGRPGAEEIRRTEWIEVGAPRGLIEPSLKRACEELGAGECAALFLAQLLDAELTLLDEWLARRIAQRAGLTVAGCLGVLEARVRKGLVSALRASSQD